MLSIRFFFRVCHEASTQFGIGLALGASFRKPDLGQRPGRGKALRVVVGNANYLSGALPTPANDAGLIAQTLQAAVSMWSAFATLIRIRCGARSGILSPRYLRPAPIPWLSIYLSGYGMQLEGENYFVPTDANIARDVNVSSEALRLSDYTKPLAALEIKANIVVLDGARANPFAKSGPPLAGGLALVEPDPGTLIAFNAGPGTVAQNEAGPYSSYAQALAEMMREGGLPVTELFNRVRLRVNDITKGAQCPGTFRSCRRRSTFLSGRRMRHHLRFRLNRRQRSDRGPSLILTRGRPISRLSIATICRTMRTFSSPIPGSDGTTGASYCCGPPRSHHVVAQPDIDTPPAYWSYLRRYPSGFMPMMRGAGLHI